MTLGTFTPKPAGIRSTPVTPTDPQSAALRLLIIKHVTDASNGAARNLQKAIGPSEVGDPCTRLVAFKVAGIPKNPSYQDPMPSVLGVAFHGWMEENLPRDQWILESRVNVAPGLDGSSDAYHMATRTVVDWKLLGSTQHSRYLGGYMSTKYKVQAHSYGQGFVNAGFRVDRVALAIFGRAKTLQDLFVWSEPWDPNIARRAIERLQIIQNYIAVTGASNENRAPLLRIEPTPGDSCYFCSYKGAAGQGLCPASQQLTR